MQTTEQPFQSEAAKLIGNFVKDELLPAIRDLEAFSIEAADLRFNIANLFTRKRVDNLYENYRIKNKNFLSLYHLYSTPDELFKNLGDYSKQPIEIAKMMGDYFRFHQAINIHFEEGFRLLEIIDRQLNRFSQSIDQRLTIILSILAITISIITAILK